MSSIVIDKPINSILVKSLELPDKKPRKRWELHIVMPDDTSTVFGRTTLKTVAEGGLFSERVDMTVWTDTSSPGDFTIETDVDGERFGDRIDMNVHMFGSSIQFSPMSCEGTGSIDMKCFEGSCWMPCLSPKTCGCEGLTGTFQLNEL